MYAEGLLVALPPSPVLPAVRADGGVAVAAAAVDAGAAFTRAAAAFDAVPGHGQRLAVGIGGGLEVSDEAATLGSLASGQSDNPTLILAVVSFCVLLAWTCYVMMATGWIRNRRVRAL